MSRIVRRIVYRIAPVAFIVAAFSVAAAAQERVPQNSRERRVSPPNATATPTTSGVTNAQGGVDEDFELNIGERRITERAFYASTAIEAGEESARGLHLRVGVGVGASEIDVLLRNVRGRVRFHGSLEALRRVLDARRPASPSSPDANVP